MDKELLEGFGITVCRACKVSLWTPGSNDFRVARREQAVAAWH